MVRSRKGRTGDVELSGWGAAETDDKAVESPDVSREACGRLNQKQVRAIATSAIPNVAVGISNRLRTGSGLMLLLITKTLVRS